MQVSTPPDQAEIEGEAVARSIITWHYTRNTL
jgi:hypothetical protein